MARMLYGLWTRWLMPWPTVRRLERELDDAAEARERLEEVAVEALLAQRDGRLNDSGHHLSEAIASLPVKTKTEVLDMVTWLTADEVPDDLATRPAASATGLRLAGRHLLSRPTDRNRDA